MGAFVWELTKETIVLPLGCLQGAYALVSTDQMPSPVTGRVLGLYREVTILVLVCTGMASIQGNRSRAKRQQLTRI